MDFDVYVLVGLDSRTGEYTPLGCNESRDVIVRVQEEATETLRLSQFTMNAADKAKIDASIASMAIMPATLHFDV